MSNYHRILFVFPFLSDPIEINQAMKQYEDIQTILQTLPEGIYKSSLMKTFDEKRNEFEESVTGFVIKKMHENGLLASSIIKSDHDALALAVHFILLKKGFVCVEEKNSSLKSIPTSQIVSDSWNTSAG